MSPLQDDCDCKRAEAPPKGVGFFEVTGLQAQRDMDSMILGANFGKRQAERHSLVPLCRYCASTSSQVVTVQTVSNS